MFSCSVPFIRRYNLFKYLYYSIMTPYTAAQLALRGWNETENRKNRHICYYRIGVEHAFAELKVLKHHQSGCIRGHSSHSMTMCVGLVCPKKSNRKAMNRNWSNHKANPALKAKAENK